MKKQRSKLARQLPTYVKMSDYHFEKGDKDGGYDNWIPFLDRNIPVDKSQLANSSNMSVLIPKQKRDNKPYK